MGLQYSFACAFILLSLLIGLDDKNSTTIKTLCLKCLLLRSQGNLTYIECNVVARDCWHNYLQLFTKINCLKLVSNTWNCAAIDIWQLCCHTNSKILLPVWLVSLEYLFLKATNKHNNINHQNKSFEVKINPIIDNMRSYSN